MIYTNKNHEDVGVLLDYAFDLEFGKNSTNDFELTIDTSTHCCEDGCFVYMEGTEYGGIIDGMKVVTKSDSLTYKGRTWHGILASKVIEPLKATDEHGGGVIVHKGGKNLFKNTANSKTISGVTFTVNEDGSVTANGTASARAQMAIGSVVLPMGEYIASQGFKSSSAGATSFLTYKNDAGATVYVDITGNSQKGFKLDKERTMNFTVEVRTAGASVSNIIFEPMIRVATDASDIFKPYASLADEYLMVSGEANKCIQWLLERSGLADIFSASEEDSGLFVTEYKMNRYADAYTGIQKMLASADGKLQFTVKNGMVVLSAVPLVDYSQDEEFDTDQIELEIEKKYRPVNHLICLGKGELAERQVLHLYADSKGEISQIQSLTGIDEVSAVYDYANAESLEELQAEGVEKLKEYATGGCVKLSFDAESNVYDIGDIVGAKDIITDITVKAQISSKIVTINKGQISIEYKVGE